MFQVRCPIAGSSFSILRNCLLIYLFIYYVFIIFTITVFLSVNLDIESQFFNVIFVIVQCKMCAACKP